MSREDRLKWEAHVKNITSAESQIAQQYTGQRRSFQPNDWIFPETCILSISTHGSIMLKQGIRVDDIVALTSPASRIPYHTMKPKSFPKLLNMWKFNAVAPGVSNIMEPKSGSVLTASAGFFKDAQVHVINDAVAEIYKGEKFSDFPDMAEEVCEMAEGAVDLYGDDMRTRLMADRANLATKRRSEGREFPKEGIDDYELLIGLYIDYYPDGRKWYDCLASSEIADKTYIMQEGDQRQGQDWGIFCLNSLRPEGTIAQDANDLFTLIHTIIYEKNNPGARWDPKANRMIRLSDIVGFVTDHGAKNLVIIDLTCSPFQDSNMSSPSTHTVRDMVKNFFPRSSGKNLSGKYGGRNSKRRSSKRRRTSKRKRNSKRRINSKKN